MARAFLVIYRSTVPLDVYPRVLWRRTSENGSRCCNGGNLTLVRIPGPRNAKHSPSTDGEQVTTVFPSPAKYTVGTLLPWAVEAEQPMRALIVKRWGCLGGMGRLTEKIEWLDYVFVTRKQRLVEPLRL